MAGDLDGPPRAAEPDASGEDSSDSEVIVAEEEVEEELVVPEGLVAMVVPAAPPAAQTPAVSDDAEAPVLHDWEWARSGGLTGRVYGREGFRMGELMTTSTIIECSPLEDPEVGEGRLRHFRVLTAAAEAALCEDGLVATRSGTVYRLGVPRGAMPPALTQQDSAARPSVSEADLLGKTNLGTRFVILYPSLPEEGK